MHARVRAAMGQMARAGVIRTDTTARMDRLPWSRWHWLVVVSLGIVWALNGLEVTVFAASGSLLTGDQTLNLSAMQVGFAGTVYLFGTLLGALLFGYASDLGGRKRIFLIALGIFIAGTFATAFSWTFWSLALFRFIAGVGIGGEYPIINSVIAELAPARVRGWASLAVNGSYWGGAIIGAGATIALMNPDLLPANLGWRVSFAVGVVLLFGILLVRRFLPESPRWLVGHGWIPQANLVVGGIEQQVKRYEGLRELPKPGGSIALRPLGRLDRNTMASALLMAAPGRSLLGFSLVAAQAFLFNSIFFTYGLLLTTFYGVSAGSIGIYLVGFGFGSLLGAWTLGRFFDTIGRRPMIVFTYGISGVCLGITGYLFSLGVLSATTHTIAWAVILFFASAGGSAAYLTVSELFPLELRGTAIAFFYAVGTAVGGLVGPPLFAALIQSESAVQVFYGYLAGAGLMVVAALVELFFGVRAERRSLESVARPISAVEERVQRPPQRKKPKRRAA